MECLRPLLAPLLDRDALAGRLPRLREALEAIEEQNDGWRHDFDDDLDLESAGQNLNRILRGATGPVLKRLVRADGEAPVSATTAVLTHASHQDAVGVNGLLYGAPGTGKTAFAEMLAEVLDKELVARQASDLVSKYVGETEQNLARLFRETDPEHSVLLLDEVDSSLADRSRAEHTWERTEVNELLQQLERYPGIFIAATNLMTRIDQSALRRFDFKLNFRALTPTQRRRSLASYARHA
jgi:MoxR-like ATPase